MCENQAFAILQKMQAGRVPYIKNDRPLMEAQNLARNPDAFISELVKTMSDKKDR